MDYACQPILTAPPARVRVDCARRKFAAYRRHRMRAYAYAAIAALSAASIPSTALSATPAKASSMSYSTVDFAYFLSSEIDGGNNDIDGDGFQLRGSLPVFENYFVVAEFAAQSYDFDVDTTRFMVGGGAHWPLANNVDIIARIGVVNFQIDTAGGDDDDTGLFLGGRIRAMLTPQFELEGGIEYFAIDVGGIDSETVFVGEARYHFNSQWSAGILFNMGSDTSNFGIHARFAF